MSECNEIAIPFFLQYLKLVLVGKIVKSMFISKLCTVWTLNVKLLMTQSSIC